MFVPDGFTHHLTEEQMQARIRQYCECKQMLQNDPNFLKIALTSDETWVGESF